MGRELEPYRAELRAATALLQTMLADGSFSIERLAYMRRVRDLMDEQLLRWPEAVLKNYEGKAHPETGHRSEKYWRLDIENNIRRQVWPLDDPDTKKAHQRLREDYNSYALGLIGKNDEGPRRAEDRVAGIVYLFRPNRELMQKLMPIIAIELMHWFDQHEITDQFLKQPARIGYYEFLTTRTDVRTMVRLIDEQPPDVTAYYDPSIITAKTQTTSQMVVEMAISLIPVVGEIVAAWEAYSGKDLFGNSLDPLDRGILGASVMFPMLGMAMKDGRFAYRETRLALLHGGDAKEWTKAMEAVNRLDATEIRLLTQGDEILRLGGTVEAGLQRKIAGILPGIVQPQKLLQSSVDKVVSEAATALRKVHPILGTLDDLAVRRVLAKGPDPDKIKGQLLEELIESRLVPWLKSPHARYALGLQDVVRPEGKLVFIPGHMISDINGRQITDGIIAVWEKGELHIFMIFEAKAGKRASRELRVGKGGISSLTDAERAELRAEAVRAHRTLQRRAELQGVPFNRKIDEIEEEILDDITFGEAGGQIRRDVERLYETSRSRPAKIFVGDLPDPIAVRISPTRTKFVGLVPSDVDQKPLRDAVRALGYNFEVLGVALSSRQLKSLGTMLSEFAARVGPAAP